MPEEFIKSAGSMKQVGKKVGYITLISNKQTL